jgi:hypothetical protein
MISGFPIPARARLRRMRTETQATFHAMPDQETQDANQPVQPIAGPWGVSMNTDLTFHRSGTGPAGRRAGRVPLLPTLAIHPPRLPAIADGGR